MNEHPLPNMHSIDTLILSIVHSPVLNVMAESVVEKVEGMIKVVKEEEEEEEESGEREIELEEREMG